MNFVSASTQVLISRVRGGSFSGHRSATDLERGARLQPRLHADSEQGLETLFASKPVIAAIKGHAIAGGCVLGLRPIV